MILNIDQFAIIADSTYAFMDKSSDNELQRYTYSDQKKRHLIKPFTVCATNGQIVDLYGPYFAINNDASIFIHVLKTHKDLNELLKPGDILILDRGFRDCAKELEHNYQFNVHLPTCKFYSFLVLN